MSELSSSVYSQIASTQAKKKQISLKNLVSVAVCRKMAFNMLKHTIALRQSSGLNTRDDRRLKQFIESIGVPKYVYLLYMNKTYMPTIGRQMVRDYICKGHPLNPKFRKKVRFASLNRPFSGKVILSFFWGDVRVFIFGFCVLFGAFFLYI